MRGANRAANEKVRSYEHIADLGCRNENGYQGDKISAEKMKGRGAVQCVVRNFGGRTSIESNWRDLKNSAELSENLGDVRSLLITKRAGEDGILGQRRTVLDGPLIGAF
jgi:hypothetical protein